MKTGKVNQGDSSFIRFFFDLFYRINGNQNENGHEKEYFKTINEALLPTYKDIDVLICGAGSCVHELPVLLTLFDKYEKVHLTFVDKASEPFNLLHYILKKYGKTEKRNDIEKVEIEKYFYNNNHDSDIETDYDYSICNGKITYSFHVMDLELDPHEPPTAGRVQEFSQYFESKKYNIVMMSMFLQHISYWRSLIAYLNEHLKDNGHFWINQLGKDDYLLTLDLYMAIIDNKRKGRKEWTEIEKSIIDYFEKDYGKRDKDQMLFSIISDNDEISPTNTEICRDFFDFFGSQGGKIFEEGFLSDRKPSELFDIAKEKFSPFAKLHSIIGGETLSPTFFGNANDEKLDFTMTWYAYPKVTDKRIKHFNVLDKAAMDIPALQYYISRTLDILNLNSTIFRPTFLRREDTSKRLVESAIDLFRRFQLFKIGDFQSIVFFIPDITTVKCLNDTTNNYIDNFNSQKEFQNKIDDYNDAIKGMGESNSTLFFDKYKTMMTKPFSIFLEPLEHFSNLCETQIEFKIDEYGYSPNQKVHIIKVAGNQTDSPSEITFATPLGVSYNHSSLTTLYNAFNKYFDEYRSILIPCFREPLFDKNKEFLGDLIIFQDKEKTDNCDYTSVEFFSWLIRKFIDFTQIATYLDYKRIALQSIKSAKAAIMSRNMSHNIGSHVMSYLKQHLCSVTTIVNDNVLAEMILASSDSAKSLKDTPLPFLVGMGHFISYLQERQDFIATIATDYIPYFASINFKDFVYDEINPDKRFERHKDRKNLQPDNILLGNIARSEGLGRTIQTTSKRSGQLSDIIINFQDSKGHIFDGEPVVNSNNITIAGRENAYEALEAMRKLEVSLPGGVIGRQAIFSIVENIIRNTAKHGNWRNQGRLELTFNFYDKESVEEFDRLMQRGAKLKEKKAKGDNLDDTEQDEYNQIIEKLNEYNRDASQIKSVQHWKGRHKHLSLMEVLWYFYTKSPDADDLYYVTITDNVQISEEAVDKLRKALIDPYIGDDSKMKEGNKGIKEIRISAAWLRGAKNEDEYYNSGANLKENQQTKQRAPLVYVRQHNGCLQYIICLQKPRNVAVITREPLSEAALNTLKERGWRYYSPENYIKERNKSYRFTLCEDWDLYDMIRPFSSSRVYVPDMGDYWDKIKQGISDVDSKALERHLYESLVSDKATIWIDDDKAKGCMSSIISEDKEYAVEDDSDYYQVKDVDVRVIDGCHFHVNYIYRKHHDTLEQFTSFMKVNPNGCKFVESITGNTSTDRLIRNEKYDYRWYYSHLNAMRKKVAIFDERLFSRIYGLEEADFTKGNSADLEELKKKYCEQNPIFEGLINDCKTADDLDMTIKDLGLSVIEGIRSDVFTKDYIALTYYQKGVCFYTLIKDPREKSMAKMSFGIYGLFFEKDNSPMPQCDVNYSCRCERVATIDQSLHVEFVGSSAKHIENQFDFLSIHQGLLDKLYEAFDIKYCKDKKIQLTSALRAKFGSNSSEHDHEWKSGFVPDLIVHSGRSKPAESDMPQMLPFIQYASIEHAVLDCKFSLIDLLENARYEQ